MRNERLKHSRVPDRKFNKTQLKMGTDIEMEHTRFRKTAKAIAKAHLVEHKKYYTYLKKAKL